MSKEDRPLDILDWLRFKDAPNWSVARPLGALFGLLSILLFLLAFGAAGWLVLNALLAPSDAGLGAGTLIVALLSAPFLIWRAVISQRTLGLQKEGHLTDRISKAVEQLGAEKKIC